MIVLGPGAGKLERVLPEWYAPKLKVFALFAPMSSRAANIRLFVEFLKARLRPLPLKKGLA